MMPRRPLAPAMAAALLVAGCGTYEVPVGRAPDGTLDGAGARVPDDPPADLPERHPAELVGRWVEDGSAAGARVELRGYGVVLLADGCQTFDEVRWSAEGDTVTLDRPQSAPTVPCVGDVASWPARVASMRRDGGRLVALDAEGKDLVSLVKQDDVIGSPYRFVGTWEVLDEPGEPTIRFGRDGDVVGFDGCNGFSGERWVQTGQGIRTTGDALSSAKGCLGGEGAWLTDVVGYRLDGDALVAVDLDGSPVATLRRAGR